MRLGAIHAPSCILLSQQTHYTFIFHQFKKNANQRKKKKSFSPTPVNSIYWWNFAIGSVTHPFRLIQWKRTQTAYDCIAYRDDTWKVIRQIWYLSKWGKSKIQSKLENITSYREHRCGEKKMSRNYRKKKKKIASI